jgi:transcriptional regulator with AAA-type ATPase domain
MAGTSPDVADQLVDPGGACVIQIHSHAARHNAVHQQTMAKARCRFPQNTLPQNAAVSEHDRKGRIVANSSNIAKVVSQALHFSHQAAKPHCAYWRRTSKRRFDCLGES